MALTEERGKARVDSLESVAENQFGPGTLTGTWLEGGTIRWKIYLGKKKGAFYEETRDDISEASALNMVRRHMKSGTVQKLQKWNPFRPNDGGQKASKRTELPPEPKLVISEELRAKALELGIKQRDIDAGGGNRKDEFGDSYWLTLEQLVELDQLDLDIEDNDEFNQAFADMREKHGIKAKYKRVKWDGYGGSSSKDDYFTGWWKGWGYSSGSGSELARRLAVALGVIDSTVQVINNTAQRWRVQLAKADDQSLRPTSFTAYDERLIVISPGALLDTGIQEDEQIAVTTGYGLHEASHTEYSEGLMKHLKFPTSLSPMAVAAILHNILEDVRIEKLTGEKFPGFAGFFRTMNAYLWRTSVSQHKIEKWGPDLTDKLNAVVRIAKWPNEFEPTARKDEKLSPEFDWFRQWVDDYMGGTYDIRKSLENALAHLGQDPQTKKQMEQQAARETEQATEEKAFREMLKKFMQRLQEADKKKLNGSCPTPGGQGMDPNAVDPVQTRGNQIVDRKTGQPILDKSVLPASTGAEVERLIREEFSIDELRDLPEQFPDQRGHIPAVGVTRPVDGKLGTLQRDPLMDRLRHVFKLRKALPMYSNRLMKSGSVDEDEMWRVLAGDNRIFEQRVIEEDPETQITLLIDQSGSMSGHNVEKAVRIGRVMLENLKGMKGVRTRVRSHTTGVSGAEVALYRIWEPGDPVERLTIIGREGMGGNYDAFAIAWCCQELADNQRPNEDMILFVLSDGRPNGFGLAGMDGIQEVRKINDIYKKKGITIIQIAIDPAVGEHYQKMMYDNYIQYVDDASLPKQMNDALIKLFSSREN